MNNSLSSFEEEIQQRIDGFLKKIKELRGEIGSSLYVNQWKRKSQFSIFFEDKYYDELIMKKEQIEFEIREIINFALEKLFDKYNYSIFRVEKDFVCTTEEYEQVVGVEFFLKIGDENIAIKYDINDTTDFSWNLKKTNNLLKYCKEFNIKKINKWIFIDFINKEDSILHEKKYKNIVQLFDGQISKTEKISIKEFFKKYFSEEEYKIFYEKISNAIKQANRLLEYQTFFKITKYNASIFKKDISEKILEIDFEKLKYTSRSEEIIWQEKISKDSIEIMNKNFKDEFRYLSLVGKEDFAKSFITAEYLYEMCYMGAFLDHTIVIIGYVKAIEQLMDFIIKKFFVAMYNPSLFCARKSKIDKKEYNMLKQENALKKHEFRNSKTADYISMNKKYEKYFDIEKLGMTDLVHFFDFNKNNVLYKFPTEEIDWIFKQIYKYADFARNPYMHRQNIINEENIIKQIRENSLLILYWLLSIIKLTDNAKRDCEILGIQIDFSFENLYKKIATDEYYNYLLKSNNNEQKVVLVKRWFENGIEYDMDNNGLLIDTKLEFLKVKEYPKNYVEYKAIIVNKAPDFIISENNLPQEIFSVDWAGNKNKIEYKENLLN